MHILLFWPLKISSETPSCGTRSSSIKDTLLPFIRRWVVFSFKDEKYNVTCAQRSVYLWSGGGRWWWEGVGDEEDGGGDSGGIATGTQNRGSKQGEALTSACFTLEREKEDREGGEAQREQDRSESRESRTKGRKQDKQQGGEEHREQQCVKCHGGTSGKCSLKAQPEGGSRAQEATLTKLRVAVRRLRREATTVPLRLRPIRLRFSPSSGSTPKRTSRNSIGCRGRKCLSDAGTKKSQWWPVNMWRGILPACYLVEAGGGAGAVRPVHTPLHVRVGGLGASLSSHPWYEPLWWAAAWKHTQARLEVKTQT